MSEETAADETMFLCSSCGFECRYEYFGKKPPFSKSVVYVFCCFVGEFCLVYSEPPKQNCSPYFSVLADVVFFPTADY